jgi:hypothetical protein
MNNKTMVKVVATKLGTRRCCQIPIKDWREIYGPALAKAMVSQPNNARGAGREGMHGDKYCNLGVHFDYLKKNTIRQYAHLKGKETIYCEAVTTITKLIWLLERMSWNLLSAADLRAIAFLRKEHGLWEIMFNAYYGRYTQMALTRRYWSPWHTDDDATHTLLCVYSPSLAMEENFDEILCYFILPTLHKAIPMRNTDVILFDSTIGHCVSNYCRDDTFIFSLFTGAKTVLTQMNANCARSDPSSRQSVDDRFVLV